MHKEKSDKITTKNFELEISQDTIKSKIHDSLQNNTIFIIC